MAAPHQHVTSLKLAQAAIFNGKGFEDAAGYARYLQQFQDRPLHPSITLDPSKFNRYGMDIPRLIHTIGWGDILPNRNYGFRPEAVRIFYANMKPCLHISPPCFTTIVYNYLITLNVELLSLLLGIPISGAEVMNELDFPSVEFNEGDALRLYTRDIGSKAARVDMLSSLRAQFILRKVDASVGRQGPVVNAPGGDTAAHEFPEDGLSLAELDGDEAVREPELPIRDNGKRPMVDPLEEVQAMFRQEETSSSRNLLMEDEDDISDYVPSPKFAY
ncbi:unnamed protein product [Linum trigynum]|uniref:Uncharacterized protein n=1 Tax=Linum trigynum TaxID=586398 RepID=A0AAV2GGR1_9ROSI